MQPDPVYRSRIFRGGLVGGFVLIFPRSSCPIVALEPEYPEAMIKLANRPNTSAVSGRGIKIGGRQLKRRGPKSVFPGKVLPHHNASSHQGFRCWSEGSDSD